MFLKSKKGFTLVEVLVSIGIIAIIAVLLSGIVSSTLKARTISKERLQTLAICTSYLNEMKSVQETFSNTDKLKAWLVAKGFTVNGSYYEKTESNVNIKIYINPNINVAGLFELKIDGKAANANGISLSTAIKGGN